MLRHDADEGGASNLKELLRARIRSAPKDSGRNVELRYATDDYLDRRIEQARQFAAQKLVENAKKAGGDGTYLFDNREKLVHAINAQHAIVLMGGAARFTREINGEIEFLGRAAMVDWLANSDSIRPGIPI